MGDFSSCFEDLVAFSTGAYAGFMTFLCFVLMVGDKWNVLIAELVEIDGLLTLMDGSVVADESLVWLEVTKLDIDGPIFSGFCNNGAFGAPAEMRRLVRDRRVAS